ncbi:MAG: hypothetical protein DMF12_03105 [Verrucomicrobia bacterium]|nr:MAG: hypothetical protein DMF12_03105 [Verrucomicrobiota bacterium]
MRHDGNGRRNGKVIRTTYFIIAFLFLIHAATAGDERSIKDLAKALTALATDVDPAEAQALSVTAHTKARSLKKEYRVVLNPEFTVFLYNIGMRKRGWCGHWAQDIGAELKELKLKTLVLHWGEAYPNTTSENNALVVTAQNQRFEDGIILDGWRRAGRLFWCQVKKDDEYEAEQHYGHSGITMWRENMKWSAWLQEYQSTEEKPKTATASR